MPIFKGIEPFISTVCPRCNSSFRTNNPHQVFCSGKCRKAHHLDWESNGFDLSPGTTGAIGELTVALDLMKKGYEVHRAMSPCSSSDLIAIKDDRIYRFEVRSARKHKLTGKLMFSKRNVRAENIAVSILSEGTIEYQPSIHIPCAAINSIEHPTSVPLRAIPAPP